MNTDKLTWQEKFRKDFPEQNIYISLSSPSFVIDKSAVISIDYGKIINWIANNKELIAQEEKHPYGYYFDGFFFETVEGMKGLTMCEENKPIPVDTEFIENLLEENEDLKILLKTATDYINELKSQSIL